MPFVPLRPPALAHLSDEAASIVLAKHFGDVVKAAKEFNVDRKDLRKLTWHNPRILNAAHERMELFHIGVKSKILEAIYSPSARRRRWGYDAMFDSYEFRDHPFASAKWFAPAPCERAPAVVDDQLGLEREAAAELERERDAELEGDRRRELGEMVAEIEPLRAPWASGWRDVDPVSEEPSSATQPPIEPVLVESELPIWPGDYPPPPLVANRYQPWALLPRRECKHEQEPRRRPSRGGWR
jgi:hypothetical protein